MSFRNRKIAPAALIGTILIFAASVRIQLRHSGPADFTGHESSPRFDNRGFRNYGYIPPEPPPSVINRENQFLQTHQARMVAAGSVCDILLPGQWRSLGPNNIGGNTPALAADRTDPSLIIAGASTGGLWRSPDGGASWSPAVTGPCTLKRVQQLIQDLRPGHEHIWYALAGSDYPSPAEAGEQGIYRSQDGGETWMLLTSTAYPQQAFQWASALALDHTCLNSDVIYVSTANGILKSSDGGGSWQTVFGDPSLAPLIRRMSDICITPSGRLYAAGFADTDYRGIWTSEDGQHWARIAPDSLLPVFTLVKLAPAPGNEDILYLLAAGVPVNTRGAVNNHLLYRFQLSDDSSKTATWENLSSRLRYTVYGRIQYHYSYNGYCLTLDVKPDDDNFILVGGVYLLRSRKRFQTGEETIRLHDSMSLHVDMQSGFFHPLDSRIYYCGNDGGIFRTDDITATHSEVRPVTFEGLNNGYVTGQFYTVAISKSPQDHLIMGGLQDNGCVAQMQEDRKDWRSVVECDGGYCEIAPAADNRVYFTANGYLWRIERSLELSTRVEIRPGEAYGWPFYQTPFVLDPADSRYLYLAAGSDANSSFIWRTHDAPNATGTAGWEPLPQTCPGVTDFRITAMGISHHNDPHVLYYGKSDGRIYKAVNIHTNPLVSEVTPPYMSGYHYGSISCLAVDPYDANFLIASCKKYDGRTIWLTKNGGGTWQDIMGNLKGKNAPLPNWVQIVHANGMTAYYLGTSAGLFVTATLDGDNTIWIQASPDLIQNQSVTMLAYREADQTLVAATFGRGVFLKRIVSSSPVPDEKPSLPRGLILHQNYPNPFNAETVIRFELTRPCHARLDVYSVRGELVCSLIDASLEAGAHSLTWNAEDMSSGVYYCRLAAGNTVTTRRMVLIK